MTDNCGIGAEHNLRMGELQGRLQAVEQRQDRHENTMAERLRGIDAKLDSLIQTIATARGGFGVAHAVGGFVLAVVSSGMALWLSRLFPH